MIGTKVNYISVLKDWCTFCALCGENPMHVSPNPKLVIYWFYSRLNKSQKGANSMDTWQSALSWLIHMIGGEPTYMKTRLFDMHKKVITKLHKKPTRTKLPFQLTWIVTWLKRTNVTPTTWWTCPFNDLMKSVLVLFIYFTISRPSEIYMTNKTENPNWEIITPGLQLGHVQMINELLHIEVWWYKNQEIRHVPKHIFISSPLCTNPNCKCRYLDFILMYQILRSRRIAQFRKLVRERENAPTWRSHVNIDNKLDKLGLGNDKFLFVDDTGTVWGPSQFSTLFRNIRATVGMSNPHFFPPYSLKNGSMSMVNLQDIPLLKVIKFVAWSVKRLPHMSQRYIKIGVDEMSTIPYEMIHGVIRNGDKRTCCDLSDRPLTPFNLSNAAEMTKMWQH